MSITRAQIARQLYRAGGRTDAGANRSTASHSSRGSIDESGRSVSSSGGGDTTTNNPYTPPQHTNVNDYIPSRTKTNLARAANLFLNPVHVGKYNIDKNLREQYEEDKQIASDVTGLLTSGYGQGIGSQYFGPVNQPMRSAYAKATGLKGPEEPTRENNDIFIPPILRSAQVPSDIESKPSDFDLYAALEGRENMNFGMNPNNMTGAMQRFSDGGEVRQRYGLGSFVKKIKRGVKKGIKGIKKFAKSDLGKAALLYAGGTYLGGTKAFGGGGDLSFLERLQNPGLLKNLANPLRAGQPGTFKLPFIGSGETELTEAQKVLLNKKKSELTVQDMLDIKKIPGIGGSKTPGLVKYGIPAAMTAAYLFTKNEKPDDLDKEIMQNYKDTSGLKEQIASYPQYRFQVPEEYRLADGGRIGYDMGGDVKTASYGYDDAMADTYREFLRMKEKKEIPIDMDFDEFLQEVVPEMSKMQTEERGLAAMGGRIGYDIGGDVKTASYGYDDAMSETYDLFLQMKRDKHIPIDMEFREFLMDVVPEMSMKQKEEPNRVMAQEGGIMNLGGLEKDYREGGFVPIGVEEKADDVPARLSKNEFVFTADAVRAAGGGSVDKGADLMYKTMKNLESRVG